MSDAMQAHQCPKCNAEMEIGFTLNAAAVAELMPFRPVSAR